jgi:hypothetical protein
MCFDRLGMRTADAIESIHHPEPIEGHLGPMQAVS